MKIMFQGCNNNLDFSLISVSLTNKRDLKNAVGNKVLVSTDSECTRAVTATTMYGQFIDCEGDIAGKENTYVLKYNSSWEFDSEGEPYNYTWDTITPKTVMYIIY